MDEAVRSAHPSRAGGLPNALVEPDGLLPFDTSSAVCTSAQEPNSSLHPAFAALPSAHPARGVDDELRWGPISMRVCTTCFAPSGPREVWDAALFHCGDRFLLAPYALVEPDGLHRTRSEPQLLRTPTPRCSGPPQTTLNLNLNLNLNFHRGFVTGLFQKLAVSQCQRWT